MSEALLVPVGRQGPAGPSGRSARLLAAELGFDEEAQARIVLVATELATNLARYGTDGWMVLQPVETRGAAGLEVIAVDRGPGIADVARTVDDGYSTANSLGVGLGTARRMSDEFAIHSRPGRGTVVVVRYWSRPPDSRAAAWIAIDGIALAIPGQAACGDAWASHEDAVRASLLVVDGLGHGPRAAEASRRAVDVFRATAGDGSSVDILEAVHAGLRDTRGAAAAVAQVDRDTGSLRFAGLGNVAAAICSRGGTEHLLSYYGTAGHEARTIRELTYELPEGGMLVVHSDGISSRWDAADLVDVPAGEPAIAAAVLLRGARRGTDDATVAVPTRLPGGPR